MQEVLELFFAYGALQKPFSLGHAKLRKRILRDSRLRGFRGVP